MVQETILQHWILTDFAFPFLLVFFIVFALLEKTKVLGDGKKQLNALVAFVIGLIFITAVSPTLVLANFIVFLTVSIVVLFVGLLLWGFISGGEAKITDGKVKIIFGVIIAIAVLIALLVILNVHNAIFDFLFFESWSKAFWTNVIFVVVIAAAVAYALKN
ncbi:hypothetical protein ISS08_02325 [Candidatus Pacearchaeota archaeon]|nr:hypothetical protein [Candidatus Pacearchaeota archaeon]